MRSSSKALRGGAIGCGRVRSGGCVVRTVTRRQYGGPCGRVAHRERAHARTPHRAVPDNPRVMFTLGRRVSVRTALALLVGAACAACAACTTRPPPPVSPAELAQGETFPYYKVYWVGRYFLGHPLTAVDGLATYVPVNGESTYYGSCASGGGLLGEGACNLPLQITSLIYVPHSNRPLGTQENVIVRGVPATIYGEGRSMQLYTGHIVIELTAESAADAMLAAHMLRPLNAPGAADEPLSPPTYCPRLYGPNAPPVEPVIANLRRQLPRRACPPPPAQPHPRRKGHRAAARSQARGHA